jgi:hypothetical protein
MNRNKSVSTIQPLMLGLLFCFLWVGVANAAPLYKGRFKLPNEVRWGQTVLPAGDYQLKFQDIGTRAFVVIRNAKSGKEVAFPASLSNSDEKGTSALFIAGEGNRRVVLSLRLADLGGVYEYESSVAAAARDLQRAQGIRTLPVQAGVTETNIRNH